MPEYIYCLPKVSFIPIRGIKKPEEAIEKYGEIRVNNALLWSSLSKRKEIILNGSILHSVKNESYVIIYE